MPSRWRPLTQAVHCRKEPGLGVGGWAALLGLVGLVPFAAGFAMRRETQLEAYTIGEHEGATFHAPIQLDLVKDGQLAFTDEMTGTNHHRRHDVRDR